MREGEDIAQFPVEVHEDVARLALRAVGAEGAVGFLRAWEDIDPADLYEGEEDFAEARREGAEGFSDESGRLIVGIALSLEGAVGEVSLVILEVREREEARLERVVAARDLEAIGDARDERVGRLDAEAVPDVPKEVGARHATELVALLLPLEDCVQLVLGGARVTGEDLVHDSGRLVAPCLVRVARAAHQTREVEFFRRALSVYDLTFLARDELRGHAHPVAESRRAHHGQDLLLRFAE